MGSARAPIAVFWSAHGSESEILQDWSEVGGLGNSLMLTHEQNCSGQGNPPLTQGFIHGMRSCLSWLLNRTITSSTSLLSTGGAVLFLSSACSQHRIAAFFSKCLISHMCQLWEPMLHNQNWQNTTATQRKVWDTRCFEKGREGQKQQQGRGGKSRHDSLKTAWKKGGKPWKQCQTRSRKLKTGNKNYSLYLG